MKRLFPYTLAGLGWIATIGQYWLLSKDSAVSCTTTLIRLLGFFPVFSDILVALYFVVVPFRKKTAPGIECALIVYGTIPGAVYQFLFRHAWGHTGLHLAADELQYSVIPLLMIINWLLYGKKFSVSHRHLPKWLLYPVLHLVYVLVLGKATGFYPYPFLDVTALGLLRVLAGAVVFLAILYLFALIFIFLSQLMSALW